MKTDDRQWIKLFRYLNKEFGAIHKQLEETATKTQLLSVLALLDQRIKHESIEETERAAMNAQLDRHDNWIHQLAAKTDTDLS